MGEGLAFIGGPVSGQSTLLHWDMCIPAGVLVLLQIKVPHAELVEHSLVIIAEQMASGSPVCHPGHFAHMICQALVLRTRIFRRGNKKGLS